LRRTALRRTRLSRAAAAAFPPRPPCPPPMRRPSPRSNGRRDF
jgi:hypothetical protein